MSKTNTPKLHYNNVHKLDYDFKELCTTLPELKPFVFLNKFEKHTIDFSNPIAVKTFNKALLLKHYGISYWEFPDENLCPPIPGRADYIHYLNDVLVESKLLDSITILDIGTGATCIYPILGKAIYDWNFIATDINKNALANSKAISVKNNFDSSIEFRLQPNSAHILKNMIQSEDKIFATMCNPPFFKSEKEAIEATKRKLKGLGKQGDFQRNFSGTSNELWYKGGEKAFLHNYLYESSLYKTQCFWYTSLVSNKDNIKSVKKSLYKLGATVVKIINMSQGNKVSRIITWTFLTTKEQEDWLKYDKK